ncbi:MAG: hypothetical protein OXH00_02835 [Candidatus Poribacteria bacterium]|nr:hypothetical protein [Candidatus Poribacteria bacterium]
MLGFLRGIEQGVAREGAAQRDFYGQTLQSKENHLDRLLQQIKYNQQMKYRQDRDARQDFVTDRAYDRGVLESDRSHQLRERADTRAGEAHEFLYDPKTGLMPMRRQAFQNELDEYAANEDVRDLERRLRVKQGEYNLGQGWQEYLEDKSLSQDLIRAQIGAYNRPRSTSRSGGPTWTQTRDITVEGLAPMVLKHLRSEGESAVWPWDKRAQFWPFGFQSDHPFVSEDPNAVSQTQLLRQAGGHLVEELINRGVDPQMALTMIPDYWDQILDGKGSDVLKRLKRTSKAAGYDDLELRKILRDEVYSGATNFLRFGHYNRPQNADTSAGADKLLDTPIR